MSELKELVPDIKLCELIPEGEFKDSSFIYMEVIASSTHTKTWSLLQRTPYEENRPNPRYPAPTWEEIMADVGQFVVSCFDKGYQIETSSGQECVSSDTAVDGAIKLWLKQKGIKYGK